MIGMRMGSELRMGCGELSLGHVILGYGKEHRCQIC